jgi:hypothetical protein
MANVQGASDIRRWDTHGKSFPCSLGQPSLGGGKSKGKRGLAVTQRNSTLWCLQGIKNFRKTFAEARGQK